MASARSYSSLKRRRSSTPLAEHRRTRTVSPCPMCVHFPTSMASPTDSASNDPANPDTTQPTGDTAAPASTNPNAISTPKEGDEHSSHSNKVETHSNSDKTFVASPTLVCADLVDQQRESVGPVEQNSTAGSSPRSSSGSLRFDIPQRPGLPRGDSRGINGHRIRNASPPPAK